MSKLRVTAMLSVALSAVLLAGCGGDSSGLKTHPASGKVTYDDGSPLPAGAQMTIAKDKQGAKYTVLAILSEGGAFKLKTVTENGKEMDGAPVGKYKVGVRGESAPSDEAAEDFVSVRFVDEKFANAEKSGLILDIKDGDNNNLTIKVGTKPAAPKKS